MKRILTTMCALTLLLAASVPALAVEPEQSASYYPTSVEEYMEGDSPRIKKVYQLSLADDPSQIPTEDFERDGRLYYLLDMTRKDEVGVDIQTITQTKTLASETNNMEKILQSLEPQMEVTTEDGYTGTLTLDHTTVKVGKDFCRFKEEAGLTGNSRVEESVSPSPFDYRKNCLLYFPAMPPRQHEVDYFDKLAEEIRTLLIAVHGHALVLFTSYAAMSAVKDRLKQHPLPFPLFTMGRNAPHTMAQFKAAPGSVLFATGAAWEGFDFPGDCVSLLVIPRLPFQYPDALQEKKREAYPDLRTFIRAVAVPEMQIRLKQGFGRAIRLETDTCAIAILDERAARGSRYFRDVQSALPEMPVTSSIYAVERFIRRVKDESYFEEAA